MTLWAQVQKLPEDAFKQLSQQYQPNGFCFEVRNLLSDYIEDQPWDKVEYDNMSHALYANQMVSGLINEITNRAQHIENTILKNKLEQSAQFIQTTYIQDPFNLIRIITHCLHVEASFLMNAHSYLSGNESKPQIFQQNAEIKQEFSKLHKQIRDTEQLLSQVTQTQEQINLRMQDVQGYQNALSNAQTNGERQKAMKNLSSFEITLNGMTENITRERVFLVQRFESTVHQIDRMQHHVLEGQLKRWHRGQQLKGNGIQWDELDISLIQEWCENLADLILTTRSQIKRLHDLIVTYPITQHNWESLVGLSKSVTSLLRNLVKSTFIIEKQPPQVMKTNTRFTSTVRLLVGTKLNMQHSPPSVSVFIISESQASGLTIEDMASSGHILPQNEAAAGEILNNSGIMEYSTQGNYLYITFRNMQLKKIKRTEKKGTESVMDEKFALLFFSRFNILHGEIGLDIIVRTFSMPVVVIVHGNQEPHAHATITWDNAFAEPGRRCFAVPEKVPFCRVGEVLSQKFLSVVGQGLTSDNLRFLAAKAFRMSSVPDLNTPLSWSQFSKEPLQDRNFTFWEWFYAILKLTKEHLKEQWKNKLIVGFVHRKSAEDMLTNCQAGTFLLRFSDSELGGLTVAWKAKSANGLSDEYYMLQPFTSRDFAIRNLSDRLNDLKQLTYLYPETPKNVAFGSYYSQEETSTKTNSGYVKPFLVTCVPGLSGHSFDSYPNTPQSNMHPHSPSDVSPSMPYESSSSHMDTVCSSVKNGNHVDADSYGMMDLIQVNEYFDYHHKH